MKRKKRRVTVAPPPAVATASRAPTDGHDAPRYYFAAVLAISLLTLLAFSNSFSTGFALDNQTLLLGDTRIQSATAANVDLIVHHTYWWPNGESGLYRPLTTLSYLLNYAILGNGEHPAGYHWINFFLHMANVLLLFALVLRLMAGRPRALPVAFVIAMLWAVHPVLTESVTNIVGRADLLAGCAVLGGFLLYLKSRETTGWHRGAWLAGLAAITAVGVFSKESAVVLPAVIVLYELTCFGVHTSVNAARTSACATNALAACLATLAPIGIMLWQRAMVLSSSLPAEWPFYDNPITGAGFWIGRLTAIKILARYLWLVFWPWKLSADYSYAQIALAHGSLEDWVCWLAVAGALALTVLLWNRNRLAFFFAGFAFLNLLPASNLLFPIGTMMAERLLYLTLAGVVAAVVITLDDAAMRFRFSGAPLAICAAIIATGFAVRTWVRNLDWTDDKSMATAGVQTSPRSFKFHRLLAAQLLAIDAPHRETDRAVAEADRSIAILAPLPDDLDLPGPWDLAAVAHRIKGDTLSGDAARAQYEETVKLALRSIAVDTASRAAYDLRHGLKSPVPASAANGYRTLASAYLHLGRAPQALAAAIQAQAIDPANTGVYEEIADADLAQERGEAAAVALAEGMFASDDHNKLLAELLKLYQSGVDSKGCAVVSGPHGPTLNPYCEIVRRDLCEATLRAHLPDVHRRLGCPN